METRFQTARAVGMILAALGWVAVVVGTFTLTYGTLERDIITAGFGALAILSGLLVVAGAQLMQATIATANNTKDILEEMRYGRRL